MVASYRSVRNRRIAVATFGSPMSPTNSSTDDLLRLHTQGRTLTPRAGELISSNEELVQCHDR
jgi:hypothetical protein